MIGAREHPDAMYTFAEHDTWFDAGAYRSIPQDMIREHAPLLAGTLDDLGHAAWLLTADVNPVLAPGRFFVSYHTVGIPDLEEALERIVSLDPAGEGRTIGMTSSNRAGGPATTGPGASSARHAACLRSGGGCMPARMGTGSSPTSPPASGARCAICSAGGGVDFARDGFVRLTAAGAEQVATNAVGLDFYNHT